LRQEKILLAFLFIEFKVCAFFKKNFQFFFSIQIINVNYVFFSEVRWGAFSYLEAGSSEVTMTSIFSVPESFFLVGG
jgi:hypothetical protein